MPLATAWALVLGGLALRPRLLPAATLAAALVFLAAWRYDATLPQPERSPLAGLVGAGTVFLRGTVDAEPEERGSAARYLLAASEAQLTPDGTWQPVHGRVMVTAPLPLRYRYGDVLELEGELEPPPPVPGFDYRAYLARRGIVALSEFPRLRLVAEGRGDDLMEGIIAWRQRLASALARSLPGAESALAEGVLLGRRAVLPADLRAAMDASGLAHLLAVSGQNVALLAGLVTGILSLALGRRWAGAAALLAIAGYALLVGGQPPVLRAAIMGGLFVLARMVGRPAGGLQPLLLAAAAMVAHDPQVVREVSFQLSFASTLGLVVLSAPLSGWAEYLASGLGPRAHALARPALEVLVVTVSAVAFVLPVMALNFGRVSLVAPVANLAAAPAFAAVLGGSSVVALAGAVWPWLAEGLWWLAWAPAAYLAAVARAFATLPMASLAVEEFGMGHALACYAGLAIAVWTVRRLRAPSAVSPPLPLWPIAAGGVAVLAAAVLWLATSRAGAAGGLEVAFLDVGQGNAVLVTTPTGRRILIDGGPSGEAIVAALSRHLRPWERRIDLVILTYPRAGRLAGLLEVLERYEVGQVLAPPVGVGTALFRVWQDALGEEGAEVVYGTAGVRVPLDGAALEVLSPEAPPITTPTDPSLWALVLRLSLGRVAFLFPSDAPQRVQEAMVAERAPLQADVLHLPGNGARGSLSPLLLGPVGPAATVLSVGEGNRFGHPSAEVVALVEGAPLFRTGRHGDVTFRTDGRSLWVKTQRQ
ncbi:ComE operon protein 3 [bacterium HR24]|nr:ComE operon protein 3 [bacterium HR24]